MQHVFSSCKNCIWSLIDLGFDAQPWIRFWNFGLIDRFCCLPKAFVLLTWAPFGLFDSSIHTLRVDDLTNAFDLSNYLHICLILGRICKVYFWHRSLLDSFCNPPSICVVHYYFALTCCASFLFVVISFWRSHLSLTTLVFKSSFLELRVATHCFKSCWFCGCWWSLDMYL